METYKKEFTHTCNKSTKKCAKCTNDFSCEKCRGVCIFSKGFLKKFPDSKILKKFVDERFYKNEFTVIREVIAQKKLEEEESHEENKTKNAKTFKDFDDEIEAEEDETLNLFRLFHEKFDYQDKNKVFKYHTGPFDHVQKAELYIKGSTSRKIDEICNHDHYKDHVQTESRQKRKNHFNKTHSSDIYMLN